MANRFKVGDHVRWPRKLRYQRITGSMTVEWEGQERPLPQLQPYLKSPDRTVRERAFRAAAAPYIEQRANLTSLFDRMYELRQRAARNAGFANFRDYIFPAKFRFDYTPSDCVRFHEAVDVTVAPAVEPWRLTNRVTASSPFPCGWASPRMALAFHCGGVTAKVAPVHS